MTELEGVEVESKVGADNDGLATLSSMEQVTHCTNTLQVAVPVCTACWGAFLGGG